MLVSVPLHLDTLPGKPQAADLEAALAARYRGSELVRVVAGAARDAARSRSAQRHRHSWSCASTPTRQHRQAVLVARLDNLGKGASGAAVQNVALMLGLCVTRAHPSIPQPRPRIAPDAFIAHNATVIGDVEIGARRIWFGCIVRGDVNQIRIGARTNVQDGTMIHSPAWAATADHRSATT